MANAYHYQHIFDDELSQEFRRILSLEPSDSATAMQMQDGQPITMQDGEAIQLNLTE